MKLIFMTKESPSCNWLAIKRRPNNATSSRRSEIFCALLDVFFVFGVMKSGGSFYFMLS